MSVEKVYYTVIDSSLGALTLTSYGEALTGLYLEAHKGGPERGDRWERLDDAFREAKGQLAAYFAGELRDFDLPVALRGTEFQRRVWQALQAIPYGETLSYAELAARIGAAGSARAVGTAVGRNPISIIVPCHRVVGSGGSLTGYAGGLDRKRWLLEHECAVHAVPGH